MTRSVRPCSCLTRELLCAFDLPHFRAIACGTLLTNDIMPKILAQQPQWLARGSAGFDFFQPTVDQKDKSLSSKATSPLKRFARRGTEVFAAVGNELRWGQLESWKEISEQQQRNQANNHRKGYKVWYLKWQANAWCLHIALGSQSSYNAANRTTDSVTLGRLFGHSYHAHLSCMHSSTA